MRGCNSTSLLTRLAYLPLCLDESAADFPVEAYVINNVLARTTNVSWSPCERQLFWIAMPLRAFDQGGADRVCPVTFSSAFLAMCPMTMMTTSVRPMPAKIIHLGRVSAAVATSWICEAM